MNDVYKELYSVRSNWYNFGLELKIEDSDLKAIQRKHLDNPDECLREVLSTWLNNSTKHTWTILANALRSKTIGHGALAVEVEKKHQSETKKQNHLSVSAHASATTKEQNLPSLCASIESETEEKKNLSESASPDTEIESELEEFRCPCKKCDLLTYICEGCTDIKTNSGSYPYLPLNKLSDEDRQDLIQTLDDDTASIVQHFAQLCTCTRKSMKDKN